MSRLLSNKAAVTDVLNRILAHELAGVVRYTHYSFMIFGYNRIPIVSWLRSAANETLMHATEAGEVITHIGSHPNLEIGSLLETHKHDVKDILLESLEFEEQGIILYKLLLTHAEGNSVFLEEYARNKISEEEMHIGDIDKMLRHPGHIETFTEFAVS